MPGYALFRSLTQQVMGDSRENASKPAFIIEEFEDGCCALCCGHEKNQQPNELAWKQRQEEWASELGLRRDR